MFIYVWADVYVGFRFIVRQTRRVRRHTSPRSDASVPWSTTAGPRDPTMTPSASSCRPLSEWSSTSPEQHPPLSLSLYFSLSILAIQIIVSLNWCASTRMLLLFVQNCEILILSPAYPQISQTRHSHSFYLFSVSVQTRLRHSKELWLQKIKMRAKKHNMNSKNNEDLSNLSPKTWFWIMEPSCCFSTQWLTG